MQLSALLATHFPKASLSALLHFIFLDGYYIRVTIPPHCAIGIAFRTKLSKLDLMIYCSLPTLRLKLSSNVGEWMGEALWKPKGFNSKPPAFQNNTCYSLVGLWIYSGSKTLHWECCRVRRKSPRSHDLSGDPSKPDSMADVQVVGPRKLAFHSCALFVDNSTYALFSDSRLLDFKRMQSRMPSSWYWRISRMIASRSGHQQKPHISFTKPGLSVNSLLLLKVRPGKKPRWITSSSFSLRCWAG